MQLARSLVPRYSESSSQGSPYVLTNKALTFQNPSEQLKFSRPRSFNPMLIFFSISVYFAEDTVVVPYFEELHFL